ncbi:Na+/H+ antiporter subunit E [bacterium]|nr:Na+/H+ antiporter subunit E [bacterium]
MQQLKRCFLSFVFFFGLWVLLTGINDPQEIITGAIIACLVSSLFWSSTDIWGEIQINPKAILYALIYPFVFAEALIRANLDVARRVIAPSLPINPGIVKVKTKLKSRIGKLILANSITLTPGTLTVETNGENFYIHWIDVTSPDIEEASHQIVQKFEKYLEVIFG